MEEQVVLQEQQRPLVQRDEVVQMVHQDSVEQDLFIYVIISLMMTAMHLDAEEKEMRNLGE